MISDNPHLAPRDLVESGEGGRCRSFGIGALVSLAGSIALFVAAAVLDAKPVAKWIDIAWTVVAFSAVLQGIGTLATLPPRPSSRLMNFSMVAATLGIAGGALSTMMGAFFVVFAFGPPIVW